MRAEDHLGEDAKGDETEEASHGATEECSGRHEVPVKSHVTKCVHELKPSSTTFSVFFLAVAPYCRFHLVCPPPLSGKNLA